MSLPLRAGLPEARTHPARSLNGFISSSLQKNRIHGFWCFSLHSELPIACDEKLAVLSVVGFPRDVCLLSFLCLSAVEYDVFRCRSQRAVFRCLYYDCYF